MATTQSNQTCEVVAPQPSSSEYDNWREFSNDGATYRNSTMCFRCEIDFGDCECDFYEDNYGPEQEDEPMEVDYSSTEEDIPSEEECLASSPYDTKHYDFSDEFFENETPIPPFQNGFYVWRNWYNWQKKEVEQELAPAAWYDHEIPAPVPKKEEQQVECTREGNTFKFDFDKSPILKLPLRYEEYQQVIAEYCQKSPFFTKWFKNQEEMRSREEFLELFSEFLDDIQNYKEGTVKYWSEQLFKFRKYRDALVDFFDKRTIRAQAEVREDQGEQQVNTTFVNQREEVSDTGFLTNQVSTTGQGISMPEREYHVRTVMAKPILVKSVQWTTSQATDHVIMEEIVPGAFINGPHRNLMSTFNFSRLTMEITIQINSNKFNKGILVPFFVPMMDLAREVKQVYTGGNIIAFPHGRIDASLSNQVRLRIPFAHTHTYFNHSRNNTQEFLGRLVIQVFNQLGATTGASKVVDVSVWVAFPECELHQPSEAHSIYLPGAQAGVEGLVKSAIPMLTDLVAPGASSAAGSLLGATQNCDMPTDPQPLRRWVPNAVGALNFGDGLSETTRLSLRPGTATEHTPNVVQTTRDDMDLKLLMKIPTRLLIASYNTSHAPGHLITSFPTYPSLCTRKDENTQPSEAVDVFTGPALAYLCRPFKYYRGGLDFTLIAVANQMFSSRIQITYAAGHKTQNMEEDTYYNTIYWDIQEKHEIKFTVPYMSTRPWSRCDKLIAIADFGERPELSQGYVSLRVVNRLTVPDSQTQSLDISILVAAADDFEVAFISDLSLYQGSGDVIAQAQVSDTVTTREEDKSTVITFGTGHLMPFTKQTLSEDAMDLKTVLRRHYKVFENVVTIDENSVISFVNSPCLSSVNKRFNNNNGTQYRTHIAHFGENFTFWTGSMRWTLVVHNWDNTKHMTVEIFHVPGVFRNNFTPVQVPDAVTMALGSMESLGVMVGTSQVQNSWSFETPFFTPYQQLRTHIESEGFSARTSTGSVFVRFNGEKNTKWRLSLYQAIGDDFIFNYFKSTPIMQFRIYAEGARTEDDDAEWMYDSSYMPFPKESPAKVEEEEEVVAQAGVEEEEEEVQAEGLFDSFIPRNPYTTALNTIEAAQNTLTSVQETTQTTNTLIKNIASRIAPEQPEDDPNSGIFSSLTAFLNGLPGLVGGAAGVFTSVAALVTGFQAYLTAEGIFVKACAIVTILREFFGGLIIWPVEKLTQLAVSVITGITGNGSKQGNQEPHAQAEILEFIPVVVGVATAALVVFGFKSIPDDKDTQQLCSNISNKLRLFNFGSSALSNVKALYKEMKEFSEWVIDQILELTAPQYLAQLKLTRGFDDVENWARFIDEVDAENYISKANYDREYRNQILRAVDQGKTYNRLLLEGKMGRQASVINGYVRRIFTIGDKMREAHRHLPIRVDPFCIAIWGSSAVGKSGAITALGWAIMDRLGYPIENRWCTHNPNTKYFTENYTGQEALYIDDMSLFDTEEQYQNFACLKANTNTPLDMAFRKGEVFTSDFIFGTTNVKYPAPNSCNNLCALQRRRDVLIEAAWRSREVMRQVLTEGRHELRENFQHIAFRVIPSVDPVVAAAERPPLEQLPISQWMDFNQLVDYLTARAFRYLDNQDNVVADNLRRMHHPVPDNIMEAQERRRAALARANEVIDVAHPQGAGEEAAEQEGEFEGERAVPENARFVNLPPFELQIPPVAPAPNAEAEETPELDHTKVAKQRWLSTFTPEFLNTLKFTQPCTYTTTDQSLDNAEWHDWDDLFRRQKKEAEERQDAWKQLSAEDKKKIKEPSRFPELHHEFQRSIKKSKVTAAWEKLRERLVSVKKYLREQWEEAKKKFPFLEIFESWPAKLLAVALALVGAGGLAVKMVHKCYCHSVRSMGYRCRMCGRWPVLDHCLNQPWILHEWQRIYKDEPYTPGRVTTLAEEETFFEVEDGTKLNGIWLGTKESCGAHVGPYSDVTRGAAPKQVVPHLGPYSDVTRGAALKQVVCHGRVEEILSNRIYSALHRVRCTVGLQVISMNALAVGGKWFLIQKHFMDIVERQGSFTLLHSGKWVPVTYEKERTRLWEGKDLVAVEIPAVQNMRSLVNHFVEEAALKKITRTEAVLAKQDSTGVVVIMATEAKAVDEQKYTMDALGKRESYVTRGMWKYRAPMGPGTCGSVLLTTENKSNGVILGLHAAGDSQGNAWAVLITKEMLKDLISEGKLGTPIPKAQFKISSVMPEGHFGLIGEVEKGIFQSDKTTIIPTAIHGMVAPVLTQPAALSSKDARVAPGVNIMKQCIGKYGQVSIPFNIRHRKMISEDVQEEFAKWKLQRRPRVLTDEEALCGIDGLEGFDRLPLNTSPGYPWVLTRPIGETGKAYLFDIDNQTIKDQELKKAFQQREVMARMGERVESVWTCCLKDERRSPEKIRAGNTRMFVIPPVDYSLLERKYMLDYSIALKDNRHISSSKVGIDPQSLEWTELYNYIAEFSEFVFAGDFKQFDGTLASDLTADFYADADAFYRLYGDWEESDRKVRAVLSDEGIHTVCLANRVVFMTHIGNKSGNPNTVNKNGDVNARYMKLAYLGLAEENGKLATMAEFHKHVRLAVYGDDNIVAVKPEVLEWYNQVTVAQFMARHGIVYTNATKSGDVKPFISLEEMTFLKQSFRDHEGIKGIKVPHMANQTITELTNWTRISPDQDELLESNCNDALRFAYFKGFNYFQDLRTRILAALRTKGKKHLKVMTYTDFHFWFLYVCGVLPCKVKAESALEAISQSGNSAGARELAKLISCVPYAILSKTGILGRSDSKDKTDDRYAIAIPSGEGKSWLCKNYPQVFVDHDDILLPEASKRLKEKGLSWKYLWGMLDCEMPKEDRRVLLVHHPGNTKRKCLGSYKLPKPNYIRANAYQRLRLKDAKVMERDDRNREILQLVSQVEPDLLGYSVGPNPNPSLNFE